MRCGRPSSVIEGDELHANAAFTRSPTTGVIGEDSSA